jgi:O-antigen/teichoic acid export membrane protein
VLWVSIPIVLLVFFFSDLIVSILFGSHFAPSADILTVLTFCIIFIAIGSVNTKILYIEHYEKKYLKRSIFGVFINIGLNFILIPIYGAIGAAIATLTTLFMIHYIFDFMDKDLQKFYYLKIACIVPFKIKKGKK